MGRPPRISRDQILDAARAAFTRRGFDATTLADIAAALSVTPAAILRHFPSKQELFTAAMSARGIQLPPFLEELAHADPAADPRVVLRRFAAQMIPFVSNIIRPAIAVHMHMAARQTTVVVPFDTAAEETPPRRGIRILTDYFARAMEAGTVRRADPLATALLFVGQLQAYVFLHHVLNVTPAYPLEDYLDAQIDLWVEGALVVDRAAARPGGTRARKKSPAKDHRGRGGPRRRDGGAAVHARAAKAEAARPRRDAGGKDGDRGVPRRRTRVPRPRR